MGFILSPDEARALISRDPQNEAVLFRYLNGQDLNSRWNCTASRYIINFHDWPIERAMRYPGAFTLIEERVKPERQRMRDDGNYVLPRSLAEQWWQYERMRPGMLGAISDLRNVLAMTIHSKVGLPVLIPNDQVFSHALVVFATDHFSSLALLSSSTHFAWWTTMGESTLETRLRYTPSDGYETFPQPELTTRLDRAGAELHTVRRRIMDRRKVGLTDLYNLVHDHAATEAEIAQLRQIHVEIDKATIEAYALNEEREAGIREYEVEVASSPLPSWRQIDLAHGLYETRQGIRFTISPQARLDVLDKLLALNHYRYEQEVRQGLHSGKGRGAPKRKGTARASGETAPVLDDGGLFAPEGTLF